MARVLMKLRGNIWLSGTWKEELTITDEAVEADVVRELKRTRMSLSYDRIAQVNIIRGIFRADIEVVNKGGADNLIVKALRKDEAESAKALIQRKLQESIVQRARPASGIASISAELERLAALRDRGILTDIEFQAQKRK